MTAREDAIVAELLDMIEGCTGLGYPDYDRDFILQTDASDHGIGAVLLQEKNIIGFFSNKFTPAQTRYTVSEKELLAVIEGLKHFKNIIYLSRTEVQTDHANLFYDTSLENNRCQRWKLLLSEYDITWKHIKGETNQVVDTLSRCCIVRLEDGYLTDGKQPIIMNTPKDMREEQEVIERVHQELSHPGTRTIEEAIRRY